MSSSHVDRNLLFGILALQMDFISRDALIAAMNAWVLNKHKPLGDVLVERAVLAPDAKAVLDALVDKHLELHRGDPQQSLAALRLPGTVQQDLEQFADPDVNASLARLATILPTSLSSQTTLAPRNEDGRIDERFDILRRHAWGGLGEVYVAEDRELHREVALKRLQERHAGNADSRVRFVQEAEITGGLEHPGIVPVYGLGMSADGRPYYAMRFIRGQTLKEAIDQFHSAEARTESERRIKLRQLLTRFIVVCNAIEYAHSRGIIHRDLKPSNIMLGKYGETLVVDWGLAKSLGRREEAAAPDERTLVPSSGSGSSETLPGSAIGTPAFMSPEQSEGRIEQIGPASDVYSLGATLYSILTGKEPFESSIIEVILGKVQSGDFVPPRQRNRAIPAALNAICLKAMSLLPKDRYLSCAELASDIEHWLADEPVTALKDPLSDRAVRWIKRHRVLAATTAALVATALVSLVIGTALLGRANSQIAAEAQETNRQREVAEERRGQADQQRTLAEERELTARRYLYSAQINLAQQALGRGRVGRVMELLDGQRPQKGQRDLRGFAWYYLYRLCHGERMTLPGIRGDAASVAVSPDGKTLAVASGGIELWDMAPLRRRTTLPSGGVNEVAFSPDGQTLASAGEDAVIKLWSVATNKEVAALRGHTNQVYGVAFSPDGKTLASGSFDGTVKLWNVPSQGASATPGDLFGGLARMLGINAQSPRATLKAHKGVVYGVAFSPNGKLVASGGADKTVRIWDAATGSLQSTLEGHRDTITPVAFSPDGRIVATGSDDTTVKLWDVVTGKERMPPLTGHTDWIEALTFSSDGRFLATGSRDSTVKVWQLDMPPEPKTSTATGSVAPAGPLAPSGKISEWTSFKGHTGQVSSLAFTPGGETLVSAGNDGLVKFWDVTKGQEEVTLHGHTGRLYSVAFSIDGALLASAGDDKTVRLWDVPTRRPRVTLRGHTRRVESVAFSPDGRTLATAGDDSMVILWDVATAHERTPRLKHPGWIHGVAFSPDGVLSASGSSNSADVKLWTVATSQERAALRGHASGIESVAFSPDGTRVASASDDGTARLWDVASGRVLNVLQAHAGRGSSIAYSADGRCLAVGGSDHIVRIWDVATGRARLSLGGHTAAIHGIAFSHDGKLLASGSDDTTVKLWDVATGEDLLTLNGHTTVVQSVAFSPDDKTLATASFDQTVKLWNVAPATKDDVRAQDKLQTQVQEQARGAQQATTAFRNAMLQNNEAWFAAIAGDPKRLNSRNMAHALDLAKKAVEMVPQEGTFWNTLGVVYYRTGDWKAAIGALEKSMQLRSGGDGFDWMFLAMAHWQLGAKEEARQWYDRAVDWMNKYRPGDNDLGRFRTEAEQLFGLKGTPAAKKPRENEPTK